MSKDMEIRNINVRRRNLVYLIQRYLQDNGYHNVAEALTTEARIDAAWEVCDNIDLDSIYLEYASYYQLKFGKYPRVLRCTPVTVKLESGTAKRKKSKPPSNGGGQENVHEKSSEVLTLHVQRINTTEVSGASELEQLARLQTLDHSQAAHVADDELFSSQEWQSLKTAVRATILREPLCLTWQDMYGNSHVVALVKEAVLAPLKHPQLFANGLRPWCSLLLHGPPGSGKTQLARILHAETREQVTFFNVSASVIISKWRGESEKMLRILFTLARQYAPSIIFFDEIEGLTSRRDHPGDHESSKRFKNELLQLLDGVERNDAPIPPVAGNVFVLATTNLPWDIDEAFLRRFEKKMLVQLPNAVERARLISKLLPPAPTIPKEKIELLVRLSENFTGDEIRLACKEIAMQTVRRATSGKSMPAVSIEAAFEQIKPLSVKLMPRHVLWQQAHGNNNGSDA